MRPALVLARVMHNLTRLLPRAGCIVMAWENWKSSRFEAKLLPVAGSAAWLALLFVAAHFLDFGNPYLPFAIAGGLIFYVRCAPGLQERIIGLLLAGGFALVVRFPHTGNWIIAGGSIVALGGLAAFLMLGWRWIWADASQRRQSWAMFAPAAALVFFVFSAQRALSLANLLYPKTYDLYLYVADGSFGFQPSFLAGKAMAASYVFRAACLLVYLSLPFVMALVYALRLPKGAEQPSWDVITLLMAAGIGGWALYNVVPATGPIYVFREMFPWQVLPYHSLSRLFLEQIPVDPDAPRNAIPSLHLAWVVLLYWSAKGLSRSLRIFLAVYFALTLLATLGTGEHYFVDLVAGLPFALFIQALVSPGLKVAFSRRAIAASMGLGLTFAWLMLVRYAAKTMLVSRVLPWGLVAVTVAAVWMMNSWYSAAPTQSSEDSTPSMPPNGISPTKTMAAGAQN